MRGKEIIKLFSIALIFVALVIAASVVCFADTPPSVPDEVRIDVYVNGTKTSDVAYTIKGNIYLNLDTIRNTLSCRSLRLSIGIYILQSLILLPNLLFLTANVHPQLPEITCLTLVERSNDESVPGQDRSERSTHLAMVFTSRHVITHPFNYILID